MDPLTYLTTPAAGFGPLGWLFFIAQVAAAIAGIYLAFLRSDSHPIRGLALRRLGYALLVLGALGTLLGALRLAAVAPFTAHGWFYLVAVAELILAAYAVYFAQFSYPALVRELERTSRSRGSQRGGSRPQPSLHANGSTRADGTSFAGTRPTMASGRRDARRDRKRRGR